MGDVMKKVRIPKGFSLAVREEGSGEKGVILLLHCLGLSHEIFSPQITFLANIGWKVIAPDARGHGNSDKPDEPVSLDDIADDFLMLLDSLGIPKVELLGGLSMGGMYAMRMALKNPKIAKKLLLMGTSADEDPNKDRFLHLVDEMIKMEKEGDRKQKEESYRNSAELVVRLCFTPEYLSKNENFRKWVDVSLKSQGMCTLHVTKAVLTRESILDQIHKIKIPTLVMVGEKDNLLPVSESEKIAQRLGGKLVVVPNSGHVFTVENPEFVNREIEKFLLEE